MDQLKQIAIILIFILSTNATSTNNQSETECQIPANKLNGQTFKSIINPEYDNDRFSGDVTLTIQSDQQAIQSLTLEAKDSNSKQQKYVYTPEGNQYGLNLGTNFLIKRKLSSSNPNKSFNEIFHLISSCKEQNGVLTSLEIKASFSETIEESEKGKQFQYFQLSQQINLSSHQMIIKFTLFLLLILFV